MQDKTAFYMTILFFIPFAYFLINYLYTNVYTHVNSSKDWISLIFLNFWTLISMILFFSPIKNFFIGLTKN